MKLTVVRRAPSSAALQRLAHLPPVLARAYAARGIEDPAQLSIGLDRLLPVGTLEGIDAAVRLLLQHRERRSRILVVGDFDADGATSSALIVRALRAWGYPEVDFLVPNRFEFGYGLTPEIVAIAAEREPALIITVDNGISSIAGVSSARERGIDVLVTDHHLAGHELPMANVIVNPNLAGATFGSRSLAGVGVAFYVMAALYRSLGDSALPSPATWLDLVALGTVADIVPLDQNNRVLVAQGLQRIRAGRCTPGVRALLETGGKLLGNVAGGNRTVELTHFAGLTNDDDDLTVKLLGNAAGGCLGLLVTLFNCGALGAELLEIALRGAQCLAAWQEEVAGITVLDADDIAELSEIWNAFEKNNVHGSVLFCKLEIRGEWCFRF